MLKILAFGLLLASQGAQVEQEPVDQKEFYMPIGKWQNVFLNEPSPDLLNPATSDDKWLDVFTERIELGNHPIKINGKIKTLFEHVLRARYNQKTDPFSLTSVLYFKDYQKADRDCLPFAKQCPLFERQGDLVSLDDEDLEEIERGNCFYVRHLHYQPTRLNSEQALTAVGAIVIGTSDPEIPYSLLGASRSVRNKKRTF